MVIVVCVDIASFQPLSYGTERTAVPCMDENERKSLCDTREYIENHKMVMIKIIDK